MENIDLIKRLENEHFGAQINLYLSKKLEYDNFNIYLSDIIEDSYWNLTSNIKANTKEKLDNDLIKINKIFKDNNRKPVIYMTPTSPIYKIRDDLGLALESTDSWLILENLEEFPKYKSKLDITIDKVNDNNINEFIEAIVVGFSSDDPSDPYGTLPDCYKIALKNSWKIKNNSKYKLNHYLARYDDKSIGTLTAICNEEIAFIYNVTTHKEYKKNGVCKEMMSYVIKDLYDNGVRLVCLQTEKGFYTEQVYENMGFKKIFEGVAYSGLIE